MILAGDLYCFKRWLLCTEDARFPGIQFACHYSWIIKLFTWFWFSCTLQFCQKREPGLDQSWAVISLLVMERRNYRPWLHIDQSLWHQLAPLEDFAWLSALFLSTGETDNWPTRHIQIWYHLPTLLTMTCFRFLVFARLLCVTQRQKSCHLDLQPDTRSHHAQQVRLLNIHDQSAKTALYRWEISFTFEVFPWCCLMIFLPQSTLLWLYLQLATRRILRRIEQCKACQVLYILHLSFLSYVR